MDQRKRAACRTQVTKTINNINAMLEQTYNEEELHTAMAKLKLASNNLKERDRKLDVSSIVNLEEEAQKQIEYEEATVTVMSKLEFRLKALEKRQADVQSHSSNSQSITNEIIERSLPAIKLQRLQLIKFDGSTKGCLPFWEQFKGAVHDNQQLSNGDRFNYLRMSVVGKAAEAIEGFPASGAFYNEALRILKDQFGNTERLIDQYFESIMKIDHVKSRNDVVTLQKNYNLITSAMRALTILEISKSQYNIIIKSSLIKSLPTELRLGFYRQYRNKPATDQGSLPDEEGATTLGSTHSSEEDADRQVKDLLAFVKNELESLEQALKPDKEFKEKIPEVEKSTRYRGSASSLLTTQNKHDNSCFFCNNKEHKTDMCVSDIPLDRKKELLKNSGRCYRCTKTSHNAKNCKSCRYLSCKRCKGRHATAMCDPHWVKPNNSELVTKATGSVSEIPKTGGASTSTVSSLMANINKSVLLQTACVYVYDESSSKKLIRMVIDGGSQLTFIKESTSKDLGLPVVGQHRLSIAAFGDKSRVPCKVHNRVLITMKGQYTDERITIEAVEVPEICMDHLEIPSESVKEFKYLQLADNVPTGSRALMIEGINLLIGADNYWSIVTGQNIRLNERLVAVNTKFGYTLHGPIPIDASNVTVNLQTVLLTSFTSPEPAVEKMWDLETIGITNEVDEGRVFVDNFAVNSVKRCNKRFEVALPWKHNDTVMESDNYIVARIRAERLKFKLTNVQKLSEYNEAMKELIKGDFAEVMCDGERETHLNTRIYYMPHRPVYRDDKESSRLRIVFDASSHAPHASSLNSLLEKGPNLNPDLIKVLLNFRVGAVGITADIEKAFLQIELNANDRDVHRFLWYDDNDELKTYRMKRLTFGVSSSPFILNVVIQKHLNDNRERDTEIIKTLETGFYVDDLVISVNSVRFAERLKQFAIELFEEASMNLRKWITSDQTLNNNCELHTTSIRKVLGINWQPVNDNLSVELASVTEYVNTVKIITKRHVLQTIARVYDPIGLIGPCLIKLKVLFQKISKEKLNWEDALPSDLASEWVECAQQLIELHKYGVPRRVFLAGETGETQLHLFADASLLAYGVVAYIRSKDLNEKISVRLLCSKNRVAPLNECSEKTMTLPRLELTATLLAVRLKSFIEKNVHARIDRIVCWSDSLITLYWIKGDPGKWKPYIANRVREIQSLSNNIEGWFHCPGRENPADLLTRGISANELLDSEKWLYGPWWLRENEQMWPSEIDSDNKLDIANATKMCLGTS